MKVKNKSLKFVGIAVAIIITILAFRFGLSKYVLPTQTASVQLNFYEYRIQPDEIISLLVSETNELQVKITAQKTNLSIKYQLNNGEWIPYTEGTDINVSENDIINVRYVTDNFEGPITSRVIKPVAGIAETGDVAGKYVVYETLADAISMCPTDAGDVETEIIMLADSNESVTIVDGQNVVLNMSDLNGNGTNLTSEENTILNNGKLTIVGNGTISSTNGVGVQLDGGTLDLKQGTIVSTFGTGVKVNGGTLTIGTNDMIGDSDIPSVSTITPDITGKTIGVEIVSGTFNFYDGVIKGQSGDGTAIVGTGTAITGDGATNAGSGAYVPVGYEVQKKVETVDGVETETVNGTEIETAKLGVTRLINTESMYVTDGVVTRLDGANNANGSHNDSTSTWMDISGNGKDGVITDGTWGDNYLEFNGSTTWANLGVINSDYQTIEATFSVDEVLPSKGIIVISNYEIGGGGIQIRNGYIGGEFYINSDYRKITSNIKVSAGTKYHVAITYDGSDEILYVNGEEKGRISISGTIGIPNSSTVMALGINPCGNGVDNVSNEVFLNGRIYSAAVYNKGLTEQQVKQNAYAGLALAGGSTNAEEITYNIRYGQQVSDFTIDDININNGTKGSTLTTIEEGKAFAISATTEEGQNNTQTITIAENGATDPSGNGITQASKSVIIDRALPTYTSAEIKNVTSSGYDVYVYGVTDSSGVNTVQFPTWTSYNGEDDKITDWQTNTSVAGTLQSDGTTWVYHVDVGDHNNENGEYITQVYIYDYLGNYTVVTEELKATIPEVSIVFDANGGVMDSNTSTTTYSKNIGETITMNNPTREGYEFMGWVSDKRENTTETGYWSYTDSVDPLTGEHLEMVDESDHRLNGIAGGQALISTPTEITDSYCPDGVATSEVTRITYEGDDLNPLYNIEASSYLRITRKSTTNNSISSGSHFIVPYLHRNTDIVYIIVARFPENWELRATSNPGWTGIKWHTSNYGTGDWKTYVCSTKSAENSIYLSGGYFYITNYDTTTNENHPTIDVAYMQAYYTNIQSSELNVNQFKVGKIDEKLIASWRAVDKNVTVETNNSNGKYKITASNLFDKTDLYMDNSTIQQKSPVWSGAINVTEDNTRFISEWIRIIPGATYKISGVSENGFVEWNSSQSQGKIEESYTSKATEYSNNIEFSVPTTYTHYSDNTEKDVIYYYMRFNALKSDRDNITVEIVDSQEYTSTQDFVVPNNATLNVIATPNSGYSASISKQSGLGDFTTSQENGNTIGTLSQIAGDAVTTYINLNWEESQNLLTLNNVEDTNLITEGDGSTVNSITDTSGATTNGTSGATNGDDATENTSSNTTETTTGDTTETASNNITETTTGDTTETASNNATETTTEETTGNTTENTTPAEVNNIAQTSTGTFETLELAIESATDGDIITLLDNITTTKTIIIDSSKNITINLNNKTITSTSITTIENSGNVTIAGGGIIKNETDNGTVIKNTGILKLENGIITTDTNGGKGIYNEGTLEISGGKVITEGIGANAIYNSETSQLTFIAGIIETRGYGSKAIYNNSEVIMGTDEQATEQSTSQQTATEQQTTDEQSTSQQTATDKQTTGQTTDEVIAKIVVSDDDSIGIYNSKNATICNIKSGEILIEAEVIENYDLIKNTDEFKEQLQQTKPSYGIYNDSNITVNIEGLTMKVERLMAIGIQNNAEGSIVLGNLEDELNLANPIVYAINDNTTAITNTNISKGRIKFYDGSFVTIDSIKNVITDVLENYEIFEDEGSSVIRTILQIIETQEGVL